MAKAAAPKKPADPAKVKIDKYLKRDIPREVVNFYRPDLRGGKAGFEDHPMNKCRHSVTMDKWCQECGDEFLAS